MASWASIVNFLDHNQYPVFRPEIGLIAGGLLCLSAAMAFFYVEQRQWGRSFLEGLLALLFVDLNTASLPLAVGTGATVALLSWWRRMSVLPALAVIGAVVIAGKTMGLGGAPAWLKDEKAARPRASAPATHRPAIIHIILDEQLGIEGLRREGPQGRQLAEELQAFYQRNGFALYGGAYSEHMHTVNAIPAVLNYGERLGAEATTNGVRVGPTEYFRTILDRGYAARILQSDFADYCTGGNFDECITYDASSLHPTLPLPLSTAERARLIMLKFVALSGLINRLAVPWNAAAAQPGTLGWNVPAFDPGNDGRSSSVGSLSAFDEFIARLRKVRPGTIYFAHLLLPHYPYVLRADCSYLPWQSWKLRYGTETLQERRNAYYAQVRCAERKVSDALRALAQSPAGGQSIVIIHGDHGSRLTTIDPVAATVGSFSDADMVATFSTLFAIRTPSSPASYSTERLPVARLLKEFAASDFRQPPSIRTMSNPSVYLDDADWRPVRRVPLPRSWLDGGESPKSGQPAGSGVSD
jgi:hypothetical protein